ncbi:MAG: nucleotidyltransferase domain-containing protein, partial [Verrucomicrobiota bacterium]
IEKFEPEKIILFGSYANGTPDEDSDVDLIVVKDTDKDIRELAAEMQMEVWHIPVAKDILVRTPADFEQEVNTYWTVFSEAMRHGKILFSNECAA